MAGSGISLDMDYLKSVPGVIKLVELLLCIISLACAAIDIRFVLDNGGGYILFVCVFAAITSIVFFVLNFLCLFSRLPVWRLLIEFVWGVAVMIAFFMSGVIASVAAPQRDPSIGAAAFFCFAAFLAYGVDAFFAFWVWRAGVVQSGASSSGGQQHSQGANVQAGQIQY